MRGGMRTKKELEKDLLEIKKQVESLDHQKSADLSALTSEKDKAEDVSSNLFTLLKYMVDENRRTTTLLKGMSETLSRLESEMAYVEEEAPAPAKPQFSQSEEQRVVPISAVDAKIVQFIQLSHSGMACAEDLRDKMGYKGKNAASSRLNRLFKLGILERHQIGKKVYYKYDAGKTTNILIVSPSQ